MVCCSQLPIRIQLDTLTITPRIIESVDIYNSKQRQTVQITILPTQPYNSPSDIAFNRPTLPADGRWTDFTGGTSEDVSLYFDPHNQRLWHLMFYRRDIFHRHNISSAPQTLDELLEVAQQLNGTDFDGDGVPDYALCYNEQPFCAAPYMLMKSVLSTTYYGHNTSSIKPLILDPDTLQPLVMNAAVHATLRMLARLSAFNDPASSARCYPYDAKFCAGALCHHCSECAAPLERHIARSCAVQLCCCCLDASLHARQFTFIDCCHWARTGCAVFRRSEAG
jgi:hypothetical protein